MPKSGRAENLKKIKDKVKAIRDAGLLETGYGKKIAEKLGIKEGRVYRVAAGDEYDEAVVDEILKMAQKTKLDQQIDKAIEILGE